MKYNIGGIIITLIIILTIVLVVVSINNQNTKNEHFNMHHLNQTTYISITGDFLNPQANISGVNLVPTTEVKLILGSEFVYEKWTHGDNLNHKYRYIVIDNKNISENLMIGYIRHMGKNASTIYFINKKTGNIEKVEYIENFMPNENDIQNPMAELNETPIQLTADANTLDGAYEGFYAPWMLALHENFSWTQIIFENTTHFWKGMMPFKENENITKKILVINTSCELKTVTNYDVLGVEYIGNISCFKVKTTEGIIESITDHYNPAKTYHQDYHCKMTLWIDTERRVLIKAEGYDYEGLKIKINLLNIN